MNTLVSTNIVRILLLALSVLSGISFSAESKQEPTEQTAQKQPTKTPLVKISSSSSSRLLGMSVTGNKESPRSLTIVPWRDALMNGKTPEITPVWQPNLGLIDPDAYRRDINLFIRHRNFRKNANQ